MENAKKSILVLMVLPLLLCLGAVAAASSGNGQNTHAVVMDEMVVTASRVEEKASEVVLNTTVIDRTEIESSSARTLGDLLAEKSIGHVHKYPGTSTSIGLRGFRTDTTGVDLAGHVLILIDGRRAGTGNVAKIMTKNIERVEIIRGPASVQYGSAAMGGVINVITRRGKGKPSAFIEGSTGSFDYTESSIGFLGKYKSFDFSGSFARETMGDYDTATDEIYHNSGYDQKRNGSMNLGYEFLPGNRISAIWTYFDANDVGNPGYLNQNDLDDHKNSGNKSIDLVYDGKTADGLFSWRIRYYDGKNEDEYVDPTASNPDWWDNGIPDKVTVDYKGAQAQLTCDMEYLLLTAGFDWNNYKTEDSEYSPKKSEYDNPAGFLLAKARLMDERLILTGGARYDDYEVDMKSEGRTESDDHITPQAGAAFCVNDWLKIRANYGEAFRMPTAQQLAADMMMWFMHYVGNPDLDPEKSKTYEGGFDISCGAFNAGLTWFHTDFEDKIESYTKTNGDISYKNLGKAEIQGIEGDISYDLGQVFSSDYRVKPYVSMTYLSDYRDRQTDADLLYTSNIQASYGITVSGPGGLLADLNMAYTGKQNIVDYAGGTYATIKKGGFNVANLTVAKRLDNGTGKTGVTLRGEIRNLFDKEYEYVQGYPMPGRTFVIGMRLDF